MTKEIKEEIRRFWEGRSEGERWMGDLGEIRLVWRWDGIGLEEGCKVIFENGFYFDVE